jgi:hypothetical protein
VYLRYEGEGLFGKARFQGKRGRGQKNQIKKSKKKMKVFRNGKRR